MSDSKTTETAYNNGYNKAVAKIKTLDDKYSQMWAEANAWVVPSKLTKPVNMGDTPDKIFISGVWAVLESLRKDGILSDDKVDKHWKRVTGYE